MKNTRCAAAPFAVWMVLFTVVPLGIVAWFAFTDAQGSFTLDNIRAIGDYAGTFLDSIAPVSYTHLADFLSVYHSPKKDAMLPLWHI